MGIDLVYNMLDSTASSRLDKGKSVGAVTKWVAPLEQYPEQIPGSGWDCWKTLTLLWWSTGAASKRWEEKLIKQ